MTRPLALPPRPSPQQPSSGRAVTAGTLRPSTLLSGAAVVTAKCSVGLGGNGCHPRARARSARLSAPQAPWRQAALQQRGREVRGVAVVTAAVWQRDGVRDGRPRTPAVPGRQQQGRACRPSRHLATGPQG